MAVLDINDESFKDLYKKNDIVVLDFWAIWCGPCQQFAPTFEKVSEEFDDVVFGKVETENNLKLSQYFQVRSIPTIIIIREGIEMFRHSGLIAAEDFVDIINQVKSADMSQVEEQMNDGE